MEAVEKELEEQVKTLEVKLLNQEREYKQQYEALINNLSEHKITIKDL